MDDLIINLMENKKSKIKRETKKYSSLFRIDGESILPPLMTPEKRMQMQRLREIAIKLEQKLTNKHIQVKERNRSVGDKLPYSIHTHGNVTNQCHDFYETKRKETEDSIIFLQNLIDCQNDTKICLHNDSSGIEENGNLLKLKKSDTFIYEKNIQNIITTPNVHSAQQELEAILHLNQPNSLLLRKTDNDEMADTSRKTIKCLRKNLFISGSDTDSNKDLIITERNSNVLTYKDKLSSDENFNNLFCNAVEYSKEENFPKFRNVISGNIPHSNSIKNHIKSSRGKWIKSNNGNISRSATSPSLNIQSNCSALEERHKISIDTHTDVHSSLTRSTSFILEGPSKVLIDHMRQQNMMYNVNKPELCSTKKTNTSILPIKHFSSNVRDNTIFKNKRIYKENVKNIRPTLQKLTNCVPYTTDTISNNFTSAYKNKKSPYDTVQSKHFAKTVHRQSYNIQTRKMTVDPMKQIKSLNSFSGLASEMHQYPNTEYNIAQQHLNVNKPNEDNMNNDESLMAKMNEGQREKFLDLLAHQEEEKRKLQKNFDSQKKNLLEQICKDVPGIHINEITTPFNVMNSSKYEISSFNHSNENIDVKKFLDLKKKMKNESLKVTLNSMIPTANCSYYNMTKLPLNTTKTSSFDGTLKNFTLNHSNIVKINEHDDTSSWHTFNPNIQNIQNLPNNPPEDFEHIPDYSNIIEAECVAYSNDRHYINVTEAATIINSYARGFLVRRLMKTETVQRVIQTIHDTLIFVFRLHLEQYDDPNEVNSPIYIQLKRQLFQQLSSASCSLHTIFFHISIRERMDLITRDRKRILSKLKLEKF